ncbi:hypothetical protein [Pseudovibrio sp. Tun.PSC04-5.I4]|uniref:hypothetical protein n=1 Tax=Pseudovibrio sp. Tun.PSC04-5.I4 TaxID=1798213 RepID=UPI000887259D|nr:hypothetical protein [Pseudovibrio sp. Tun.PSC04-5.I4]SDR11011.1 hypothetical protein SAMN04515695_2817 [Pseudovibrio sp. Tun.PSC04-5.I4]
MATQKVAESLAGCANIAKLSAHTGRKGTASMSEMETEERPTAQKAKELIDLFAEADESTKHLIPKIVSLSEEIDAIEVVTKKANDAVTAFNQLVRLSDNEMANFMISTNNRKNLPNFLIKTKDEEETYRCIKEVCDMSFIAHVTLLSLRVNIGSSLLEYLKHLPKLAGSKFEKPEISMTIKVAE